MPTLPILDLSWKILLIVGAVKCGKQKYNEGAFFLGWGFIFMLFYLF